MADDDSSEPAPSIGIDEITAALVGALRSKSVDVDDDGVNVTLSDSLYHYAARLSKSMAPLPKIPDDTSGLEPGSVEGAAALLQGAIQMLDTMTRVTMRIVSVATSEILQAATGDADGVTEESVGDAAEEAISGLSMLTGE